MGSDYAGTDGRLLPGQLRRPLGRPPAQHDQFADGVGCCLRGGLQQLLHRGRNLRSPVGLLGLANAGQQEGAVQCPVRRRRTIVVVFCVFLEPLSKWSSSPLTSSGLQR